MNPLNDRELQAALIQRSAHQVVAAQRRELMLWRIWCIAGWVTVLAMLVLISKGWAR